METNNDSNPLEDHEYEEKEMERILKQNEYASSALLKILHHINKEEPDSDTKKKTDSPE